ncbi:glutamyl-tRNA reductase [Thiohalobacter sp. COW1]|uniref:Glutamyl-tRNA reductase n=1 Tax=Thiohalobacter thiocyanaticus TaxID=585455 RepID=A0A1Z4VUR0_9GAMM|nr:MULTISPECIES: glutamyl-tRNA reductase [Thiohalobacter]BAZ95195.1 glutamyl-tRNA reductase [Thiohalobacter thiocyanaticus]BCO32855.1 glutamyl-tRNA reductase [Thiohalobacter sp. COW1]
MSLIALGINHRTAPVDIRERVAFPPERMPEALRELTALPMVQEGAILSTCNRTEIYCHLDQTGHQQLLDWLSAYHRLGRDQLQPYVYVHPDLEAVKHLLRVSSGLDSMVLGEPQILGQLKDAFQAASEAGTVSHLLNRLFQHTFSVAKQIRTDTAIGASPVSVAFAAVRLARQIYGDLGETTALLIGAGETIELAARHLHEQQLGRMIIANRTVERAHALASQFNGYAIALDEIPAHLAEADIIIASTASQTPVLRRDTIKTALKARKHKPVFMVDIAVPRDIEPEVGKLEDVYLYTIDDLQQVIQEGLKSRREAAHQAEEIIEVQASHFYGWLRSLDAVQTIRACRDRADASRREVLDKALAQLRQGREPEAVLEFLAHTLTNKLLHAPSANLRQAGYDGRAELIEAARELFGLDESGK